MHANKIAKFKREVWGYYRSYKRDLPWRRTRDPYKILVSEVMLQQTQVERVLAKYRAFLRKFPTVHALRKAPLSRVLRAWQGLGYNRRALMLKKTAEAVVREYKGRLPREPELLRELPGVGAASAGAVAAFAFGNATPFVETNIRRAFIHYFFPKKQKVSDKEVLELAERALDRKNPREWHWALMDYGSYLGRHYGSRDNPNKKSSSYHKQPPFRGSNRELRGKIIRFLIGKGAATDSAVARHVVRSLTRVQRVLSELEKEGFILRKGKKLCFTP